MTRVKKPMLLAIGLHELRHSPMTSTSPSLSVSPHYTHFTMN